MPVRHAGADEAGADDHDVDAAAGEVVAEAARECVRGRLRGAVGVVGHARAVGGDGGQQDDRAAALAAHVVGAAGHDRDGARAVDGLEPRGVSVESAVGHDRDVDALGAVEDRIEVRAREVEATTSTAAPAPRSGSAAASARAVSRAASTTVRARSATSARAMSRPISEVPPKTATDCTDPSASLMSAPAVETGPSASSPPGRSSADLAPAVQVGVHRRERLGPHARVLGQVDAPAGVGDELVELVEQPARGRRRRPGCRARASSPACGNDSSPGCPAPKRLSTARNDAARRALSSSSELAHRASRRSGTTYWYWRKPRGP